MIEHLTRLAEKGSSWPDNQPRYDTSQRCPKCLGWKRKERINCDRCGGDGQLKIAGGQKQDRAAKTDSDWTSADVAGMCAGLPQHKFWAALVYVNKDMAAYQRLQAHLLSKVVLISSLRWKLSDDERVERAVGLTEVAMNDFLIDPDRMAGKNAAEKIGVSIDNYHKVWKIRKNLHLSRLMSWVDETDAHMVREYIKNS